MDQDSARREIELLRANVDALRAEATRLSARLLTLEKEFLSSEAPAPRPLFHDTLSKFAAHGAAASPTAGPQPIINPLPPPIIVGAAPPIPVRPPLTGGTSEVDEMRFGATWFNRIGAIILLLAVSFFVKYSFDQGWLGPLTRVLLGAATGLLLIAGGEYSLARNLRHFAVGLIGAGVAMLYVAAYSAHAFYYLIGLDTAFILYCGVTALGTLLAVHGRMQAVAILTLIGAFVTPVVLSTGRNAQVELLTYVLIIDIGFLAVGAWRRWDALRLLSWLGTLGLFLGWGFAFYDKNALDVTLVFIVLFYVHFHAEALIAARLNWGEQRVVLPLMIHLNNFVFIASVWLLADSTYHKWMGLFLIVAGVMQRVLAKFIRRPDNLSRPTQTNLGIDCALTLSLFPPVQFDNCTVAIAWGLQAVIVLFASIWLPEIWLRVKGVGVITAAAIHLIAIDTHDRGMLQVLLATPNDLWHLNYLILSFAFVALCAFAGAACLKRRRNPDPQDARLADAFACLGAALLLGIVAHQYDRYVATMCWLVFFLIATGVGRLLPTARAMAIAIVFVTAAKYVAWDLIEATQQYWSSLGGVVLNRAVLCGVAVAAACALVRRHIASLPALGGLDDWNSTLKSLAAVLAVVVLFAAGTFEILRTFKFEPVGLASAKPAFAQQLWLSLFWSMTAIGSLTIGMAANLRELRYLAVVLFAVTIGKAMIVDLNYLRMIYRIVSFGVLGVLLLLASLFYQKRWSRLHKARPTTESTDA